MGFDIMRFCEKIEPEFICSLCDGVFVKPVQILPCEHMFCCECISNYVTSYHKCPIDKRAVTFADIARAPRIIINLLMHLKLECENREIGCNEIIMLENLNRHRSHCEYNEYKFFKCSFGCGHLFTADELRKHTCTTAIPHSFQSKDEIKKNMEMNIYFELKKIENYREIFGMVECAVTQGNKLVKASRRRKLFKLSRKFADKLPIAKISHWSSLIFNNGLKTQTKNAFIEAGCPTDLVFNFVKYSSPVFWPKIFHSIAERRKNRIFFEDFLFRRLPDQQIVILFGFDNIFIEDEVIAVFNFASGIKNKY